ncbi:hypothetical protein Tco_0650563 [Tanacetum coccineum]
MLEILWICHQYGDFKGCALQAQDHRSDFKRLRRQDIKDMLLLLVQGKLTNLSLDDRYVLNVALRMYTRRIVIQECVEDLQLAVESYQKKINLTKPDSHHSDLRKMTPYTAYPDIQGIIYQDDLNRIRLMRTDELHKFSDGTLNYVRTTLNDIASGIRMDYLLKIRWSQQDKRRARVMISAIDRKLRDRRLMRSLEKFVGGRPYKGTNKVGNGDFRYSDTVHPSRSDEVLKLKNFEKDAPLQLSSYQIKKGMSMSATKDAGQLAGLNVMLLIIQPTSAAIAYGLDKSGDINSPNDKSVCIFDMGRGTFDVSLLIISKDGTFTFKAVGGDTHLGSKDFDKTMGKFEELNSDFFHKCIEHVETCLRDGEFFDGKPLCKSINIDEAKAYVAAALASNLCGNGNEKMKDLIILDETPLSLGIRLGYETMSVVIQRNTPIPTMKEHVYNTQFDNQVSAELKVYQRESNNIKENILLGSFVLDDIPAAPIGEQKLKFLEDVIGLTIRS